MRHRRASTRPQDWYGARISSKTLMPTRPSLEDASLTRAMSSFAMRFHISCGIASGPLSDEGDESPPMQLHAMYDNFDLSTWAASGQLVLMCMCVEYCISGRGTTRNAQLARLYPRGRHFLWYLKLAGQDKPSAGISTTRVH